MTDKQAADYRDKLLRAAKALQAYLKEGATVESAAEEAHVDPKTLRRYMGDKELINDIFGINGPIVRKKIEDKIDNNKHRRK